MVCSPLARELGRFAAVTATYFFVSLLGVAFVVQPEQLSVFWPGGGLLLGYLLVVERRQWPTVLAAAFVGNVAGNLAHGHTPAVSGGFAVVNAVEPLAAAWLLGRLRGADLRLDRTGDVGWLFLLPLGVCAATALAGAGVVTAGLGAPSYWGVWKVWWLADAVGILLFAPLVLAWAAPVRDGAPRLVRVVEAGVLLSVLAAVVWAIFASDLHGRSPFLALPSPVFPLLLFVTLRSGLRGTTAAVAVVSLIAAGGTLTGGGPVVALALSAGDRVLFTQGFVAVISLSSLVLATAVRGRGERAAEVVALNRVLAERVREAERAAAALRESERRFQAIFHSQFQFIGLMTPDGTLVEANRTALAAAGVAEADVIGTAFWDTVWWAHDPVQQDRLRAATAAAAGGERVRFEASHPTADGGRMWVDFSLTPFRDAAGRVVLLIPEGRDISARKAVEARLRASEERFRALFEQATDALFLHAADGVVVDVNRQACDALGYRRGELVGQPFRQFDPFLPPDEHARLLAALSAGEPVHFESRHRRKDGSDFPVEVRMAWVEVDGRRHRLSVVRDVTEPKRAEARLRASEERFRVLFEQSSDAHLIFDDGGIIDCNNAAIEMLRCGDKSSVLALHPAVLSPEFQPDGRRSLEKCVEMDATARRDGYHRFDWTHRRMDGEEFPCEVTLTPVVLAGRSALLVVWHDLTERARAAAALRASEERFRAAMEGSLHAVYFLEAERGPGGRIADFRFTELNGRGADMISRARTDILGRRLCELLPTNRTGGFFDRYVRVAETGEPLEEEFRIGQTDGIVATWLHHQVVRVADGVVITSQDISDRKRAEAALQESEARFRSSFEDAAVGMALVGLDGRWLRVNRSLCGIVGYDEAELLVTDFQTLTHPDDLDADLDLVRRLVDGSLPTYQTEKRYFHKAGHVVWVLLAVSLVRDGGGEPLYFVSQIQDISERKSAEEQVRASLREKDVMLREIHHRVKNNLAVIASLFHLQSGYITDAAILRLLKEAQDRVRSMALVHEHLYNAGDLGAVNFGEYTRSLAEQLFRSYRLPGSPVRLELDIGSVTLGIDQAVPCGLVLNELVSNGLKHAFAERGGRLTVGLAAGGAGCVLRVTDDGAGIPADRLEGKPRSLGLRLIRTLARQLNGTVEFRPADPGTEVRLVFPVSRKAPGAGP